MLPILMENIFGGSFMHSRRILMLLIPLCLISLGVSLWFMLFPVDEAPQETEPVLILSQQNGQLATFLPQDTAHADPTQIYPVYTRLLPEIDQRELAAGIEIYSDTQLNRLLEDYGL